jgi:hypothetical protein
MAAALLEQVETWTSELHLLENRLASTPAREDDLQELRTTIETLAAQRSSLVAAHADVALAPPEKGMVNLNQQGLFLTTPNGIIMETNTDSEWLFNFPTRWLIGKPLLVFVARDNRRAFLQKLVSFKFHHPYALQAEWHLTLQPVNDDAFRAVVNISKTLDHAGDLLRLAWLVRRLRYDLA